MITIIKTVPIDKILKNMSFIYLLKVAQAGHNRIEVHRRMTMIIMMMPMINMMIMIVTMMMMMLMVGDDHDDNFCSILKGPVYIMVVSKLSWGR